MATLEQTPNLQSATHTANQQPTYDLICVGFGPAQLATAIALRDSHSQARVLFLERKPEFSWHPSSILPRTRMENAFVYDLATTRNPRSEFTYVNYLHTKERIVEFANMSILQPLREEFDEYLKWCAEKFQGVTKYGSEAVGIVPIREEGMPVKQWTVAVKDSKSGSQYVVRARSIAVPSPAFKDRHLQQSLLGIPSGQSVISTEEYLERRQELRLPREPRLNTSVVGSSDQSIEILDDLLKCPQLGNITFITESEALAPLKILNDEASRPPPRLCSIWARPSSEPAPSLANSSELIKSIYASAYEKQVASKGHYSLHVVMAKDAAEPSLQSDIAIVEKQDASLSSSGLFHDVDPLILGCRQKGKSLEEVQFKRGAVAEGCKMWMMSASSGGGRSLARDIAVRAGEVVDALPLSDGGKEGVMVISARM
ncbi:hypothetical protein K469DRAFT_728747 [Zopfia rhizophila CBS 207.26]|uniref:L-ornithine N(5)-monooxygenase [NAD(P)H] n=1 Tax=Zopfia rhizophila CBS 207.26 TaxID=1314779 RepID=A0A6A6EQV3_9PEZI|nr:hypothetical protein K469DRAFT_728747 [Zopfia rhizophila CBS 207.26]